MKKNRSAVEVYRGRGAQPWRYRVVAGNGEVTAASEGYTTRWSALRGARRLAAHLDVPVKEEMPLCL